MHRYFLKEEEFVDEFTDWAFAASGAVEGEWRPDTNCDDGTRAQRDYFLRSGELSRLAFMSAAVRVDREVGYSAQIILESAARLATAKVWRGEDGKTETAILVDRSKKE